MTNSIVYKFSVQLTIILAILFSVLLLSNVYSLEVVRNHSQNNSRNTLAIYAENIRNNLNIYAKDLLEVFENNVELAITLPRSGESDRYFKSMQLMGALKAKMSNSYASDGMFIKYSDDGNPLVMFGKRMQSAEKWGLIDLLSSREFSPAPAETIDAWKVVEIQGIHYFFQSITYSDISFGTFVSADSLLSIANREADRQNQYVLSERGGLVIASTSGRFHDTPTMEELSQTYQSQYLLISEPIAEFGKITNLVAKQSVFSGLKLIQWIIISLGVISVVIVPLALRYLARDILKPVLELVKAAKEVEKGHWEFQIPPGRYTMEFSKLFHAFNSMIREITELKIHSYEEKIERSRTELKYLQMQIRPHFYLNAISTISSLTYRNKNEEIRKLIQHLSEHLRYMFRGALHLVPIKEEIRHVENYVRMQEIRYPDQIFFMTDIASEAERADIPQFLIQTFVENAFKHAMKYGEMLSIFIRASVDMSDGKPCMKIVVEDNGEGFPAVMLPEAESHAADSAVENGSIGIANIRRTLQLLYKREDLLKLSNAKPSGARVEIWVPSSDISGQNP